MEEYCKNCGAKLAKNSKFCPDCGTSNEKKPSKISAIEPKHRNIIIILIAIIAVLAIAVVATSGIFHSEVPMETMDFGGATMLVPKGADFVEYTSMPPIQNVGGFVYLQNKGEYSDKVNMVGISTGASVPSGVTHMKDDEGVQIFKDDTLDNFYFAVKKEDDYYFSLMGTDYDTMARMLKSVKVTDNTMLKSQSSGTSSSQTTASSPAPSSSSSMSIKSGSFSTGSAEEDKTYASIYVGKEHAGESVTVQIWYSRDGNTLNNGNMVPATVHSDGYLEIASADAYHYYPDHATINLYNSAGSKIDSRSVSLSPTSGTQTF